jgi:hypothetical protein
VTKKYQVEVCIGEYKWIFKPRISAENEKGGKHNFMLFNSCNRFKGDEISEKDKPLTWGSDNPEIDFPYNSLDEFPDVFIYLCKSD